MNEACQRLARMQAGLVQALVGTGPVPRGFDESRVRACARSLVNKRRQALSRVWPRIAKLLGDGYPAQFARFAESQPLPASASTLADGRAFLAWLEGQGPLSDQLRFEAFAYDVRWTETPFGVRPRGGCFLKTMKLHEKGGCVIALRLPWLGLRWWGVPRKGS